jgi:CheY-like chemotaxis protein
MTNDASAQGRILIADDEEVVRTVTAECLRRAGYHCDCARDAPEAISAIQEHPYDLLITDICMPGNAHLELLRASQEIQPGLPVVVATGYPTVWTAVEAVRLSVVDYLIKPLQFPDVLQRISLAVEKGRLLRSFAQVRQQTTEWLGTIADAQQALTVSGPAGRTPALTWSVDQCLSQMAAQMVNLTLSLKTLSDLAAHQGLPSPGTVEGPPPTLSADLCLILQCPRRAAYERALHETIEVLEKTKTAFKSKDLADLRKRLETLLKTP